MEEKVLVPLDSQRAPTRAFVCLEGIVRTSRTQPMVLGPSVSQEDLGLPLRDYLERRAKELQEMGIKASPVFVHGGRADSFLNSVESSDAGLFVISIHGPYKIEKTGS